MFSFRSIIVALPGRRASRGCSHSILTSQHRSQVEGLESRRLLSADPSLVTWLTMDERWGRTAIDASGHNNDGRLLDGVDRTAGVIGSAASFDAGDRQRIVVRADDSLDVRTDMTVSAWVKPDGIKPPTVIVEKAKFNTDNGFELSTTDEGTVLFRLNQATRRNRYCIESTSVLPTDGQTWVHVAGTYDGHTMRLYINGVLEASETANIRIGKNRLGMSVGAQQNGSRAINGEIDDVRLYNRSLDAGEIAALAGAVATPTDPTDPTVVTDPTTPTPTPSPTPTPTPLPDPTPTSDPEPDPSAGPLKLLFYGNSFTNGYEAADGDTHLVTTLLSKIAVAAGFDAPIILNKAVDRMDLSYHLSNFSQADVASDLDYVILQEKSTKPTNIAYNDLGDPTQFKADALALLKKVAAIAPDAQAVMYETWAQPPANTKDLANYYPSADSSKAAANQMQSELRTYYNQAADLLDTVTGDGSTQVAPVGDAFQSAGWTGLYDSDNHHASDTGYALSAMVLFETVYHTDVKDVDLSRVFSSTGISQATGQHLQDVAEVVNAGAFT